MRRALLALTTVLGLTAGMLSITLSPSGALDGLFIDLAVDVTDSIDPIGAGNGTIYTVTVTNTSDDLGSGVLTAPDVRLTGSTTGTIATGDSSLADDSADGACATTATTFSCEFTDLASLASQSISVVSNAGTSDISLTAAVAHGPSSPLAPVLDTDTTDNTDTEDTDVQSGLSTGYVAPGECTEFTAPGNDHKLCVPSDEENGVIVTRFDAGPAADGGPTVKIDFSSDSEFQANVDGDFSWGVPAPCRGLGIPSQCLELRWRKSIDSTDPFEQMDRCPTGGGEVEGEPCLEQATKIGESKVRYLVDMDSDDPQIGPLKFG